MDRHWSAQDAMLDFAKAVHDAIGIESPRIFITVFAAIGLFLFGGLGWVVDAGYRAKLREQTGQIKAIEADSRIVPVASNGRLFLPKDIDVQYLTGLYKDHTSIQGDKLASDFIGKWMSVSMIVEDVQKSHDAATSTENFMVVAGPKSFPSLDSKVALIFSPDWSQQVSLLRSGSQISAVGVVDTISGLYVSLKNCELR